MASILNPISFDRPCPQHYLVLMNSDSDPASQTNILSWAAGHTFQPWDFPSSTLPGVYASTAPLTPVVSTPTLPTPSLSPSYSSRRPIASNLSSFTAPLSRLPTTSTGSYPILSGSTSSSDKISFTTATTQAGASTSVATSSNSATTPSHHSPRGAVVGGIVASVLIILIIFCLFFFWLRRRRRNHLEFEHKSVLPVFSETTAKCSPNRTSTHYLVDTRRLSQVSHLTPLRPGAIPRVFAPQNNGYPVIEKSELLHDISSWEANNLSRQNEILRRENEEFWDEIENLQRVNGKSPSQDVELSK